MTGMTEASTDTPGVIIFPPLIPISVLVVGIVLNLLIPLGLLTHVLLLRRIVVGTIAFVVGIGMVIGANRIFRRIGTNVNPFATNSRARDHGRVHLDAKSDVCRGEPRAPRHRNRFGPRLGPAAPGIKPASRALRHYPT
jgi:hypothetical protein